MSQSSAIAAALGAAFLIYITQRGELRTYMGFLFGDTGTAPAASASGSDASGFATAAKFFKTAAEIFAVL